MNRSISWIQSALNKFPFLLFSGSTKSVALSNKHVSNEQMPLTEHSASISPVREPEPSSLKQIKIEIIELSKLFDAAVIGVLEERRPRIKMRCLFECGL